MAERFYTDMDGWRHVINVVAKTTPEYERGVVDGMRTQLRANNRPWVGLTEEERNTSNTEYVYFGATAWHAGVEWAEAKLKEKNK